MIIFNIKFFVAHSDRALRDPPCSNDVTYLKNASGPARRSSSCLLGKALDSHKVCQVWCAMEFLLISDKETLSRCINISEHGNSSRYGKLYPPPSVWKPHTANTSAHDIPSCFCPFVPSLHPLQFF